MSSAVELLIWENIQYSSILGEFSYYSWLRCQILIYVLLWEWNFQLGLFWEVDAWEKPAQWNSNSWVILYSRNMLNNLLEKVHFWKYWEISKITGFIFPNRRNCLKGKFSSTYTECVTVGEAHFDMFSKAVSEERTVYNNYIGLISKLLALSECFFKNYQSKY